MTTSMISEGTGLLTGKNRLSAGESEPGCAAVKVGKKVAFFGHFGWGNFGNESTLQAMLCHFRSLVLDAEFSCICTDPKTVARTYNIKAVSSRTFLISPRRPYNRAAIFVRRIAVAIPNEVYRWLNAFTTLRGTKALIVPGTGVLTDAYTLFSWGPYDMFRWSVAAKMCHCKLFFVSVGAGPIYSRVGRFFVKTALLLADYRSYRDESTAKYLQDIGFRTGNDPIYPDLAFSLPESLIRLRRRGEVGRPVVGLGLMEYAGKYSVERPTGAVYSGYLETLVKFAEWLLAHEYNIRLLIGDLVDTPVTQEFTTLLNKRSAGYEEERIISEPVTSVEDLLKQLAATDIVVATRFHNVLLSLLLNKPVLAISFHHKCSSLMKQMGLSEYCQDINHLNVDRLVEQFSDLTSSAETLRRVIRQKTEECRRALSEQYNYILQEMWPSSE